MSSSRTVRLFASWASLLGLFAAASVVGCSSASPDDSGGASGETKTTSDDEDSGSSSCNDITSSVATSLQQATATADVSCATDTDCQIYDDSTDCSSTCGVIVSNAGAATLAAVVAKENSSGCSGFAAQGCKNVALPCAFPGPAVCVANKCTSTRTSPWSLLELEDNTRGIGLPTTCTTSGCSTWTVTPDASIVVVKSGVTTTKSLSDADFATIDTMLRSSEFASEEATPSSCITSAGAVYTSIEVVQAGVQFTTCANSEPDYGTLYNLVKGY